MRVSSSVRQNSFVIASACLGVVAGSLHAATATYDGGPAGSGLILSNPVNWVGDVLPADGDTIVIASGTGSTFVTGSGATGRSLYLNDSLANSGGVPFTGTPPTKSFQSITYGTEDPATTFLPTSFSVFNSFDNTFVAPNTIRLTGDANGRVINLAAGATTVGITLSSSTAFGKTTVELAGATPAANTINIASATSRITVSSNILAGTNGFTKTGLGSLFLNAAEATITGDIYASGGLLGLGVGAGIGPGTNTVYVGDTAVVSLDNIVATGFTDSVAASHTFNLTGANSRISVGTLEQWTISGAVGGTGGLNKTGSGTLTLSGALSYTAPTVVTVGSLAITGDQTLATSKSLSNNGAGTLTVSGAVNLGSNTLTLGGSTTASVSGAISGAGGVTATGSGTVSLTGANTYTGTTTVDKSGAGVLTLATAAQAPVLTGGGADVRNGTLVIEGGDAVAIRGLLAAGFAAPTTPGVLDSGKLRSSTATVKRGLGYAVVSGNVVIKPALFGDADLDGGVSINDFNALAGSFGSATGKFWVDGDFDYDGGVSINDFNLLAGGFGQSLPATSEMWAGLLAFAAAHNDLAAFEAATGVPEPTTAAVLLTAGVGLSVRRRRA